MNFARRFIYFSMCFRKRLGADGFGCVLMYLRASGFFSSFFH
jgi:hypothetical protein